MASDDRSHQIGVRLLIVDEQQTKDNIILFLRK